MRFHTNENWWKKTGWTGEKTSDFPKLEVQIGGHPCFVFWLVDMCHPIWGLLISRHKSRHLHYKMLSTQFNIQLSLWLHNVHIYPSWRWNYSWSMQSPRTWRHWCLSLWTLHWLFLPLPIPSISWMHYVGGWAWENLLHHRHRPWHGRLEEYVEWLR